MLALLWAGLSSVAIFHPRATALTEPTQPGYIVTPGVFLIYVAM
jgi:hypothetical protein